MNNVLPAINSSEVSKDLSLKQTSYGENSSFDEKLSIEEKKLEERTRTLNPFSWGTVQSIFNFVPLEFDFNLNIASIENNFDRRSYHSNGKTAETIRMSNLSSKNGSPKGEAFGDRALISNNQQAAGKNIILNEFLSNSSYFAPNMEIIMPFSKIAEAIKARSMLQLDLDPIIESISKYVKLIKAGGKTTIELTLKPEHLGNLILNISSKNGVVSVEIIASKETQDLMEANLGSLKEALAGANINIGNLEVSTNGRSKERENDPELQPVSLLSFNNNLKLPEDNKIEDLALDRLFTLLNELSIYSKV